MISDRLNALVIEYGIRVIDGRSYPGIRETRAVATMERILSAKGEAHMRLVLCTVAETENNQGYIDKYLLWAVSDLVDAYRDIVEQSASDWLDCFDRAPVAELQVVAKALPHQRYALVGMLAERVARQFGPNAGQGELFDERRRPAA